MGKYLKDARRHSERIKHFYDNAGEQGYAQATHHFYEIEKLALTAARCKSSKGEAPLIQVIRNSVQAMMDEMKKRAPSTG